MKQILFISALCLALCTSCLNVQSNPVKHHIDIDEASSIPTHIAAQYVRDFTSDYTNPLYEATFNESNVVIRRESNSYLGMTAINNKQYAYSDLAMVAQVVGVSGIINQESYQLVLLDKRDVNHPELYTTYAMTSGKSLNMTVYLYTWFKQTSQVELKDFKKFLNALASLGVHVYKPKNYQTAPLSLQAY